MFISGLCPLSLSDPTRRPSTTTPLATMRGMKAYQDRRGQVEATAGPPAFRFSQGGNLQPLDPSHVRANAIVYKMA